MEIETKKLTTAVCIIALTVIVGLIGKVLVWVWLRPKRLERFLREQGCQGNSYNLLFGDLKAMGKMMNEAISKPINIDDGDIAPRVLPFHYWLTKNYGKNNYLSWKGPEPTVTLTRPEEIKHVFKNYHTFLKPPVNPLAKLRITGLEHLEGEKWAKHRKIVRPAFHLEKLKLMLPAFLQCCNQMVNEWKTLVSENGSYELDVWPFLHRMTGDTISRTAFGSSFEETKRILQLQIEQADLTAKVLRSMYIPGWRFVPTKQNKRLYEIDHEIQYLIRGIIHKREKAMKKGETLNDLLGLLLESNNREIKEHGKNVGMSIEEVVQECKLFYSAGHETTSVLLNWTIVLLSTFPNWQAQAREEIKEVFGTKEPDYDGLNRLNVVTMILYEVLRLYPPTPILSRVVGKETKLGNLTLPAGTEIMLPILFVHHDEELWGNDANEFKPERFSEGVLHASKGKVSFLPFGWGPRICIGQNFALLQVKMALSMILQHFSFELSPFYTHAPKEHLLLVPQFGTPIILHKLYAFI